MFQSNCPQVLDKMKNVFLKQRTESSNIFQSHVTLMRWMKLPVVHQRSQVSADTTANMDGSVCGGQACVPWLGSIIRMRVISRLREVHELIFVLPQADALAYILFSAPDRIIMILIHFTNEIYFFHR